MTSVIAQAEINNKRSLDYEWILFDADETLFSFDDFTGLKNMFSTYNVDFTEEHYSMYKKTNEALWTAYQNHEVTAGEIKRNRFTMWSAQLVRPAEELNSAFLMAMSDICEPLDGAINLLHALKNKNKKLGIVTNGFIEWQEIRLARFELAQHIDVLVTSEQAGIAKPHPAIFDRALTMMGNPPRERVLMVGDNPHSDILGGINSGLDTCWFNVHNKPLLPNIIPTYQVASLPELENLLLLK